MAGTKRRLVAIMFTDIIGYTAIMQQSEEQAIQLRDKHRSIFNKTTEKFGGKILQYYGDGTLSIFDSAIDAVRCGIEMQLSFQKEPEIPVRIGIHSGDIVINDEDIIGDGVNVASRIESLGVSGSVLISDKVQDEIKNQGSIQSTFLKAFSFKNVEKPMNIYAISNEGLIIPKPDDLEGKTKKEADSLFTRLFLVSKTKRVSLILLILILGLALREVLELFLAYINISPIWSNIFMYSVILLLPTLAAMLFIPSDRNRFLRIMRKIIPPVNVIGVIIILVVSFWSKELGAMTRTVSYVNDEGVLKHQTVVKPDFIKHLILYTFEYSGQKEVDSKWLEIGIPVGASMNLNQFQSISSVVRQDLNSFKEKTDELKIEGDYMILGQYDFRGDSIWVKTTLYNQNAKVIKTREYQDLDFFSIVEQMKMALLNDMDLYPVTYQSVDLPFNEFVTDNLDAFKYFVEGQPVRAIQTDEDFTFAYLNILDDAFTFGSGERYRQEMAMKAMEGADKLPERLQLYIRSYYFLSLGEKEKALRSHKNFIDLNPGDLKLEISYLNFLARNEYYDEAIEFATDKLKQDFNADFAEMALKVALFTGHTDEIRELINRFKYIIPKYQFQIIIGLANLRDNNYDQAIENFENALIEKPLYFTLDSLIKHAKFMKSIDPSEYEKITNQMKGLYASENSLYTNVVDQRDQLLFATVQGQFPHIKYLLDSTTFFQCTPYNDGQGYLFIEYFQKI